MRLRELMDAAWDEMWFCVVTPDNQRHFFWNADYVGGHPDVMPELEPLLDREFDEFYLELTTDPETKISVVPTVCVELLPASEEPPRDEKRYLVELERTLSLTLEVTAKDADSAMPMAEDIATKRSIFDANEDSGWSAVHVYKPTKKGK